MKILIVDDHPVFRQGLIDVVRRIPDIVIVGEACDGKMAIELCQTLHPDVVLLDVNLPFLNGLQVTRQVKHMQPQVKIIIITGHSDTNQVIHALCAGASACQAKDASPTHLLMTIEQVYAGNYVINDRVLTAEETKQWVIQHSQTLLGENALEEKKEEVLTPLSIRETQILQYVIYGHPNKEIARILNISHQTVKNHMTAIFRKLNMTDRLQAAVYALHHGWIRLD